MSDKFPRWFIEELALDEDKIKAESGALSSNAKVLFKCDKGHPDYLQIVKSHIRLSTGEKLHECPLCGNLKKSSCKTEKHLEKRIYPNWFINDLYYDIDKDKAINRELLSSDKVYFSCPSHGKYLQKVGHHIKISTGERQRGCPECNKDRVKAIKKSSKKVVEKREVVLLKCNLLKKIPKKSLPKVYIKIDPYKNRRAYPQWFTDLLVDDLDKKKALEGTLKASDIVTLSCCNYKDHPTFKRQVSLVLSLINGKKKFYKCPVCAKEGFHKIYRDKRNYPEWFINDILNTEDVERAKNGSLTTKDIIYFCCEHGHHYLQRVADHINISSNTKKHGCPLCSHSISSNEKDLKSFLDSLGISYISNCRNILDKKELDIYIPDKNLAIEYNGSFWHKTLPVGISKERLYHYNKFIECNKLGIHLISVFDVDLFSRESVVKNYIRDLLKTPMSIYARKCILKKVSFEDANNLYDQNHILGKTPVITTSYGLYYNDELVACMSFQKGRYKEEQKSVWCLSRFVTKSGYVITGGASKLLRAFEREYKPELLVSYSDNDYFKGGIYSILGFTDKGFTRSPRYYWYLNNTELKRERCQLRYLSKQYPELYQESLLYEGNKEDYIMLKLGACKVYRSGNRKWVKYY